MQFPNLLVMGATGRIGGVLRAAWCGEQLRWQAGPGRPVSGSGWVRVDPLADPAGLARAAEGCSAILCLSGVTPPRAALGADLGDNARLAEAAVHAGAVAGARVVLTSSAAVYGNRAGELDEDIPLTPQSDYGRAKADMETRGATLAAQLGVPLCSLRIGNIAGLDAILGGWRPGFRLDRFAGGRTPRRSYIGPLTLARVLGDLVAAADLPGVLNVAAPGSTEMGALLDAAGLDWAPQPAPDTAIAEVRLSVRALQRYTPLDPEASQPAALVREWREMKELLAR